MDNVPLLHWLNEELWEPNSMNLILHPINDLHHSVPALNQLTLMFLIGLNWSVDVSRQQEVDLKWNVMYYYLHYAHTAKQTARKKKQENKKYV